MLHRPSESGQAPPRGATDYAAPKLTHPHPPRLASHGNHCFPINNSLNTFLESDRSRKIGGHEASLALRHDFRRAPPHAVLSASRVQRPRFRHRKLSLHFYTKRPTSPLTNLGDKWQAHTVPTRAQTQQQQQRHHDNTYEPPNVHHRSCFACLLCWV